MGRYGQRALLWLRTLGQVPDTRRKEIAPEFSLGSQDTDPVPTLLAPLTAPLAGTPWASVAFRSDCPDTGRHRAYLSDSDRSLLSLPVLGLSPVLL